MIVIRKITFFCITFKVKVQYVNNIKIVCVHLSVHLLIHFNSFIIHITHMNYYLILFNLFFLTCLLYRRGNYDKI